MYIYIYIYIYMYMLVVARSCCSMLRFFECMYVPERVVARVVAPRSGSLSVHIILYICTCMYYWCMALCL